MITLLHKIHEGLYAYFDMLNEYAETVLVLEYESVLTDSICIHNQKFHSKSSFTMPRPSEVKLIISRCVMVGKCLRWQSTTSS